MIGRDSPGGVPSVAELKRICRKADRDPYWICDLCWRPLSIHVTRQCLRLGITADQVTAASALFAVGSALVLLVPSAGTLLAAAAGLQVYLLLDLVDGEVARYEARGAGSRPRLAGPYCDRLVHYLQGPALLYCLGAGLAIQEGRPGWALLGVIAGLGRSWFPRLVAADVVLPYATAGAASARAAVERVARQGALVSGDEGARPALRRPGSRDEWLRALKQVVYFPGDFFLFGTAAIVDAALAPSAGFPASKVFLGFYALLLGVHGALAFRAYRSAMARTPHEDATRGNTRRSAL